MEENVNSGSSVFAIISLVCGIVSVLCCCCGWLSIIFGVGAIVLGIISLNNHEDGRGMAIAGIICGGIGTLIAVVILIVGGLVSAADIDNSDYMINEVLERIEEL